MRVLGSSDRLLQIVDFPGSGIDQLQVTQDRERVDYPTFFREASFVGDI